MTTNLVRLANLFNSKCRLNTAKENATRKSFFNVTNVTLSQTLCL